MNTPPDECLIVMVTAGSAEEADRIAAALVDERLAACVNVLGPARSVYRWQGEIERAEEWLLIIKTTGPVFPTLEARVKALHSYEMPEVITLPVVAGSDAYLAWVRANATAPSR